MNQILYEDLNRDLYLEDLTSLKNHDIVNWGIMSNPFPNEKYSGKKEWNIEEHIKGHGASQD